MKTLVACTFLAVLLAARFAWPQERFDPAARAKVIAPFVDEQTVAVLHADLTRVALVAVLDEAARLVPDAEPDVARAKRAAGAWLAGFARAGGRDAYVVVSMADISFRREYTRFRRVYHPPIVLPRYQGTDVQALATLFPKPYELKEWTGGVLVAADAETLRRLQTLKPDQRPELAAAFEAVGDTAVQALLLPPKYAARVVEEMLPQLPKEIGGGPSTVITRGVRWAAVGVDPPPKACVGLVVQSKDAPAAEALRNQWTQWLRMAGEDKEVRAVVPDFDKLAALAIPKASGDRLLLAVDPQTPGAAALVEVLAKAARTARDNARRSQSMNHLKQIGLAMHNYHDAHKSFPAAATYDAQGRPLLSWRVHLLPYLCLDSLYKQFRLDEPWDSPHNRKLIQRMPAEYRSPASQRKEQGYTSYLVPAGKETVFPPGGKGTSMKEIKDGSSNTVMVVEVDDEHAMPWTKPEDLTLDPKDPAKGLGGLFKGGFNALYCDGHVELVPLPQPAEKLRALFTPSGGEAVSP